MLLFMNLLCAWIGVADLAASRSGEAEAGPISAALAEGRFGAALLLADWPEADIALFKAWLMERAPKVDLTIVRAPLTQPNAFGEIYRAVIAAVDARVGAPRRPTRLTFYLSPGTPAMASIWLILSKTRYDAELIESSRDQINIVDAPFDLAAELLPDLLRNADRRLGAASAEKPTGDTRFGDILYRSEQMARVVALARKAALRRVPILIEGESGTGKELLARAIHSEGLRPDGPLIVLNCGAIPRELVESQLFGHRKGAFTGAIADHVGVFEAADRGTLFLDEIGELPLEAQVKLLRVVQESEVVRVGDTKPRAIEVRIIAATNRNLFSEVKARRFREDLFYRLAVLMLKLPALRQREGDVGHLIDSLLERVNAEMTGEPDFAPKTLSAGARNRLLAHDWPGNVRELQNTLRRLCVWTDGATIRTADIDVAMLPEYSEAQIAPSALDRPIGDGFSLEAVLDEVAKHYIVRATGEAGGNKSKAARLVGFSSYQRFENWQRKYLDRDEA